MEEEIIQDELYENPVQLEEEQDVRVSQEPIIVETKGKWIKFEEIANTSFEVGKVYNINVGGNCKFMISKYKPSTGFTTNNITYTKDNENFLWIKTR